MSSVVAYVPALHRGYIDFFKRFSKDTLYILDLSLVREMPRLERDIRVLDAEEINKVISGLGLFREIKIPTNEDISDIPGEIIMPDEEVSHFIAEKYFSGKKITFIPVF